ncbi:MAG: DUF6268 family outer membrane beta-barrel protein [Candidatus Omnitrophota bacterium]
MSIKEAERSRLLPALFLSIFLSPFVLSNAYADEARAEAQEQAIKEAEESSIPTAEDFRQRLRRTVVIQEEEFAQGIDSFVQYMPSRGVDAQSGKVGVIHSAVEYSYQTKAFGKLPVEFAVGADYLGIDNTTVVKLPAHLTGVAFGAETTFPLFNIDKTYLTIGLAPSLLGDDWNFDSSHFRMLQRYFLIHQPNEQWTFIAGVAVFPDYDDDIVPILGFIYRPNDRLTFNIIPKRPEISYALDDKFTVFAEADMSSSEFEVDKDTFKDVIIEYNEMHAGLGLKYKPNKYINSSVSVGGMFNRSIKYRDDNLGKVTIKDGLYTEFRLELSF